MQPPDRLQKRLVERVWASNVLALAAPVRLIAPVLLNEITSALLPAAPAVEPAWLLALSQAPRKVHWPLLAGAPPVQQTFKKKSAFRSVIAAERALSVIADK